MSNRIVIGRRGTGKSTLAEYLAIDLNWHTLIFDPNKQYKNADLITSDLSSFEKNLQKPDEHEQYIAAFIPIGDIEEEFTKFVNTIWKYGDYSLIIDEAHRLQKPQYINPALDKLIRQAPQKERGDKHPIDIIQTVHRMIDVNGIVLSLADIVYIFRTTKQKDLEYIEREFGPKVAEEVQTLRTKSHGGGRDFLVVEVEGDDLDFMRVENADEWYIDLRKPASEQHGNNGWIRYA